MDIPKAFDVAAKTPALLVLSVFLALGSWMLSGKFNTPQGKTSGWDGFTGMTRRAAVAIWDGRDGPFSSTSFARFSSSSPPMRWSFDIAKNPRVHPK
jgi:hypothetical protein